MKAVNFAYFGGEPLGVPVLEELKNCGFIPKLIICNPDRPQGRKLQLTPPPVKVWAEMHDVEIMQPETLRESHVVEKLRESACELFVVVAYGSIIPKEVLEIPKHGTINLHPSLLPKYRGPNPIREAILQDDRDGIGVSIMLLDEEMDHGPLLSQKKLEIAENNWPIRGRELDEALAHLGGALLANIIPKWITGEIQAKEQDHTMATFTKKLSKEMGELDLDPQSLPTGTQAYQYLLKIRAYDGWPGTYFFTEKDGKHIRVKVTDAKLAPDGSLEILKVIPEGKKEMNYNEFARN